MNNKKYLIPFASCLFAKGASQAIMFDSQRNNIKIIPDTLVDFVNEAQNISIEEIKEKYVESIDVVNEYINFLISEEICFIGNEDEKKRFPKLSLNWDEPSLITNAIVDINKRSKYNVVSAIEMLDNINCLHLQIRIYDIINVEKITELLEVVENSSIRSLELICDFNNFKSEEEIKQLPKKYKRIGNLVVYNSPYEEVADTFNRENFALSFYAKNICDDSHCGNIAPSLFCKNVNHYFEAQKHNTCLNRKISIDVNGEIKNCPSMQKSYGNIENTTLKEALEKQGFKDLWFIAKDQIEVCKDCEFRYICTDCRAFIKDENNIYSKPAKCKYNPYTAKFED